MDALTALSVASSVIQFVDFGSKLLSNSRKLYKSAQGVLTENVDVETITSDLSTLTQGLKRKLPQNRLLSNTKSNAGEASGDDEALDRLCKRCVEIAEELMKRLHDLKVEPKEAKWKEGEEKGGKDKMREVGTMGTVVVQTRSGRERTVFVADGSVAAERPKGMRFRKWESFRKALEASWDKKQIEALAATLREFRGEIEFRILVSFRGSLKELAIQQSQTSQQLAQSTRLVLDTFMNSRDGLADQLRLQAEKILEIQAALEKKEKDGPQKMEDYLRGELPAVGTLQSGKGDSEDLITEDNPRGCQVEEELRLLMIENGILRSLSFATLTDRQESVEVAHSQTFEWIYESATPWSNFIDWLRRDNGIYWISGKAGSGKSTLMRFIYEDERTKIELQKWAGSMQAEICGFFFWNSGDEEQKSQRGLFRSLLFEILNRHRDLLSEIVPEVWEAWSTRAMALISSKLPLDSPFLPPEPKSWTTVQLHRAVRKLLNALQNKVKLSLFIDGLDEYEGDYDKVIDLVEEFALSPDIKICLSSRPLMAFERAFANVPMLRLQTLTRRDISHYVTDRLYSNKYMIQLSKQHAAEVSNLVDEIVGKASGVFLWVKLVVKSLLHGLRDHNRISDLQKRVRHLPADLEALYTHMLKHTDRFYYEQASQIFQIVRVAQKCSPDKVTLLNLSWADDEDETLAETTLIQPLTQQELSMRCKTMDARLKSVCVGLLESNDTKFSSNGPDAKVQFLHRTVSDWFKKETVWDQLLSRTAGTGFSPNLAMLKSCILRLKSLEVSPNFPLDMSIVLNALEYAKGAEAELNYAFPKLLDQLDIAASYQWRVGKANGTSGDELSGNSNVCSSNSIESLVSISKSRSKTSGFCRESSSSVTELPSDCEVSASLSMEAHLDDADETTKPFLGDIENDMLPRLKHTRVDWANLGRHMSHNVHLQHGSDTALLSNKNNKFDFEFEGLVSEDPWTGLPACGRPSTARPTRSNDFDSDSEIEDVFEDALSIIQDMSFIPNGSLARKSFKDNSEKVLKDPARVSCALPEEGVLHHWSYGIELPGIKPLGQASTFYNIARDMGLNHYVNFKYQSGIIVDQDVNQHLLEQAIPRTFGNTSTGVNRSIDPVLVEKTLAGGADPNFSYTGATPWDAVLAAAVSHLVSHRDGKGEWNFPADSEWINTAEDWAHVFRFFLQHGADPNALSERHHGLPGHPRLSPLTVVTKYFSPVLPEKAAQLKLLLQENGAKDSECGEVKGTKKENVIRKTEKSETTSKIKTIFSWFWF